MKKILWIDDEIDTLKPLINLLKERGYDVTGIASAYDGLKLLSKRTYDLIIVDQIMPGKSGIETVSEIRELTEATPVIMLTKSEDEKLIDDAYRYGVNDFLVKPIKFQQLLATIKKLIEMEEIKRENLPREYSAFYGEIKEKIEKAGDFSEWVKIYLELIRWDIEFENYPEMHQIHRDLIRLCEDYFSEFVEENYLMWLRGENAPIMTKDILKRFILPLLKQGEKIYLIVFDCMRLDQWFAIKKVLKEEFYIEDRYCCAILPSATQYSRRAIFAGMMPLKIENLYPNLSEDELLKINWEDSNYILIRRREDAERLLKDLPKYKESLVAIVIQFLDFLLHSKKGERILEELAPDEKALRNLTKVWFENSLIFELFKKMGETGRKIFVTTDHGSIIVRKAQIIKTGLHPSPQIRFKIDKKLECDERAVLLIKHPEEYGIMRGAQIAIAKSINYLIFPTKEREYTQRYKGTFQHGGISLQEMVIHFSEVARKG